MNPRDGAEQIFDFAGLEDGNPDLLACAALQLEILNG